MADRSWTTSKFKKFLYFHFAQTGSEAHLISCPIGTVVDFAKIKAAGTWNSPLTSIYCLD
jgi:hypothetical protein